MSSGIARNTSHEDMGKLIMLRRIKDVCILFVDVLGVGIIQTISFIQSRFKLIFAILFVVLIITITLLVAKYGDFPPMVGWIERIDNDGKFHIGGTVFQVLDGKMMESMTYEAYLNEIGRIGPSEANIVRKYIGTGDKPCVSAYLLENGMFDIWYYGKEGGIRELNADILRLLQDKSDDTTLKSNEK